MKFEVDEQTLAVVALGAMTGYLYHTADPATRALLTDVGLGVMVVSTLAVALTFVSMLTEMMLFDYLWSKVRGDVEEGENA